MRRRASADAPKTSFALDARRVPAPLRRIRERARRRCLALPGAVEEFPWGAAGVYKVRGKIFASTDFNGGAYEIAFKPPEEEREDALALPFIRIADYVGRYGWVQASVATRRQLDVIWPWLEASYRRLAAKVERRV